MKKTQNIFHKVNSPFRRLNTHSLHLILPMVPDSVPKEDLKYILNNLKLDTETKSKHLSSADQGFSYDVNTPQGVVSIPHGVYALPPQGLFEHYNQEMLFALFTRSSNGYVRERFARELVLVQNGAKWTGAYILLSMGDYVWQVQRTTAMNITEEQRYNLVEVIKLNPLLTRKIVKRIVSYSSLRNVDYKSTLAYQEMMRLVKIAGILEKELV